MFSRRLPLTLLAVLVALAVGLWVSTRGAVDSENNRASLHASTSTPLSAEPVGRADLAKLHTVSDEAKPDGAPSSRTVVQTAYENELARGLFVEGRVVFPPETPADERVRIIANGKEFEHGPPHAVDVGPDGSFRIAFAEGTKYGRLELEAQYLYLQEAVKVSPGTVELMVLEPLVGGMLSGKVQTVAGLPAERASITPRLPSGSYAKPYGFTQADAEGNFKLTGLSPADYVLGVVYDADQSAEQPVTVEAGKECQIAVRLAPATLVRVAVRDGGGTPTDAELTCLRSDGRDYTTWLTWTMPGSAKPDEKCFLPLPPGTYTLTANRKGGAPVAKTVKLSGAPVVVVELGL